MDIIKHLENRIRNQRIKIRELLSDNSRLKRERDYWYTRVSDLSSELIKLKSEEYTKSIAKDLINDLDLLDLTDKYDKIEFKPDGSYFEIDDISIKIDWINRKCSAFRYGEYIELIPEKDGD